MHKALLDHSLSPSILPSHPFSQETERVAGRHQHVREVALSLFASEGYANVSLRQLAEHLGMRAGSLYNHIESKQDLLFELIHDHLESLLDYVEWRVNKSRGVEDKLKVFIASHIDFHLQHMELSQLSVLELRNLDSEHMGEIADIHKSYSDKLGAIISEGIKSGLFHSHPLSVATTGILGMLNNIAFWFTERVPISREQLISQYTTMVCCSLRVPPSFSQSVV